MANEAWLRRATLGGVVGWCVVVGLLAGRAWWMGEGWIGWISKAQLVGAWAGLGVAWVGLSRRQLGWGVAAAPWLGLVTVWPWVEPSWLWETRWPLDVVWGLLGSACGAWMLWRVCTWTATRTALHFASRSAQTPWYLVEDQRGAAALEAAQKAFTRASPDPVQERLSAEPWMERFMVRGLRVALWGHGASVEARDGGWPEANQKALQDEATKTHVSLTITPLRITLRGRGEAAATLAAKAISGWATRTKAATAPSPAEPHRVALPLVSDRHKAQWVAWGLVGLWVGVWGVLSVLSVLVFPVVEGSERWGWLLVGGLWGLTGGGLALQRTVFRRRPEASAAQSAQAASALLMALHDEPDDTVPQNPLWWPLVAEGPPQASWRSGAGVGVLVEAGSMRATLHLWPMAPTAHGEVVRETLCVSASGDAGLTVAYLRAGLLSAGLPCEGQRQGDSEMLHLESARLSTDPSPWRALSLWWELTTQGEDAPPPTLLKPWRHELGAVVAAAAQRDRFEVGARQHRRGVWGVALAVFILSAAFTQLPKINDEAFQQFKVTTSDATEIAAAASDCPPLGTNTHQHLEALRCIATATGQHQPLRRIQWDVLLRPLELALDAHKALLETLPGQGCEQGRHALPAALTHPSVRLSMALLARHHPKTWGSVRSFFWSNNVLQKARALHWDRLDRWIGGCQRVLNPDDVEQLRRFYALIDGAIGDVLR